MTLPAQKSGDNHEEGHQEETGELSRRPDWEWPLICAHGIHNQCYQEVCWKGDLSYQDAD